LTETPDTNDAVTKASDVYQRALKRLETLQARHGLINRSMGEHGARTATVAQLDELEELQREIAKHEALCEWAEREYNAAAGQDAAA
jgi:hypothetical protein